MVLWPTYPAYIQDQLHFHEDSASWEIAKLVIHNLFSPVDIHHSHHIFIKLLLKLILIPKPSYFDNLDKLIRKYGFNDIRGCFQLIDCVIEGIYLLNKDYVCLFFVLVRNFHIFFWFCISEIFKSLYVVMFYFSIIL